MASQVVSTASGLSRADVAFPAHADASRFLAPLGRFLFAAIFLLAAPGHFTRATIAYAAHQGVPLASFAVPLSGALALAYELSIVLGRRGRRCGRMLMLCLATVTALLVM